MQDCPDKFPIESTAELVGAPLYSISGGELSDNVPNVEQKLKEVFGLTERWGAVVLLDEADVVMSKRGSAELERNAIVAGQFIIFSSFGETKDRLNATAANK
ncbi:hypothetical protein ACMFMG_008737 [Clarireedia jacksonii]